MRPVLSLVRLSLVALLLPASPAGQGGPAEEAARALERGAFEEAHRLLEQEQDPLERARGRAELFHRARDPGRALEAAREGLRRAPDDLTLLYRAAAASLWLGDAERSAAYVERLGVALEAASLAADDRTAWREAREAFAAEAARLGAAARARARAVRRARGVVAVVLGGSVLTLFALFVRAGRADRSGSPRR